MEVISAQDWPPYSFYPPHSSPNISGSTCRRPEKQRASTMRKLFIRIIDGDSHRIQTCNLLIRSQMLYSVELANLFCRQAAWHQNHLLSVLRVQSYETIFVPANFCRLFYAPIWNPQNLRFMHAPILQIRYSNLFFAFSPRTVAYNKKQL